MMKPRKDLSMIGILHEVRCYFETLKDVRGRKCDFSVADHFMSALGIFSLKFPSLLQFDQNLRHNSVIRHNFKSLFGVNQVPSDTHLREFLDVNDPQKLRGVFKMVFALAQRGKLLEDFVYLNQHYLLAIDGTGFFSSDKVFCKNCCEKHHQDGTTTYYHQMLCGVLVHPKKKGVLPFAPEPICNKDGNSKNDCERNASKRFLEDFRREHPHLKTIVTEDSLSSNAPHINLLKSLDMSFILGARPGNHTYLFEMLNGAKNAGTTHHLKCAKDGITHEFHWLDKVPLNDQNPDCLVNFLEYSSNDGKTTAHWSWVTDLDISRDNVMDLMKAGRARWSIENETFNTLKNQGYCFEHNFGHGYNNLSTIFGMLMVLAFLIDQIQELSSEVFKKAIKSFPTRQQFWFAVRAFFAFGIFDSWENYLNKISTRTMMAETPHDPGG